MNRKASDGGSAPVTIDRSDLVSLFGALRESGYQLIGPSVKDGAIVYDRIESSEELPIGWTDIQEAASYRLARRDDQACFGFVVGPHSWKRYLFPPGVRLWSASRSQDGFDVDSGRDVPRLALIGVRACELAAIGVQDAVLIGREHRDTDYASRRANVLLLAVNCTEAGGTCFCVSMGTGPTARSGYDLALTEIVEDGQHYFVLRDGSNAGAAILERLRGARPAAEAELASAARVEQRASEQMGRQMETEGLPQLLSRVARHPHWDDVAERCLSCANCTLVCPTCFCHNVEDVIDLTGENAERWRHWDSCFNGDYSYIHGGKIRPTIRGRYRQWLTHKLGSWHDQFGTSGCVGCGRCITWCPVGIDITAEVRTLQSQSSAADEETSP